MSQPIRILYVDDNRHDRELVRDSLVREHGGFQITEASSRQQFESLVSSQDFDLVLSDFNILGFDGLQVIKAVRGHHPKTPVIIVTGTGSEEIGVEAIKNGAADYVIKTPRHIQKLPQTILSVLENERISEANERANLLLHESEALFQTIAKLSPVGIYRTNAAGDCVYANESWHSITGLKPDEARGQGWVRSLYPEDRQRVTDLWYETARTGKPFRAEYRFQRPDGSITWVLGQGEREVDANDQMVGYVGTVTDITERKRMEEELMLLDQMKDNFIRMAAHELKTPVTVVKGFTQLALRQPQSLTPSVLANLEAVNRGAARIAFIVDDLLDVSRLQSGRVSYRLRDTELLGLAKEVVESLSITLSEPERLHFNQGKKTIVSADPLRIEQVISNLINNAIKHSPQGGQVELSLVEEGPDAVFSVSDHGVGIPKDKQAQIFQPFFRAHAETPQDFGGMGVGLYISKEIITGHGGRIWFESVEGQGSTFSFSLPLAPQGVPIN